MSQPRNRPSVKEWTERKPQIEQLYLEENRTLEEVSTILAEDNFHATIRQYKTRLKAWGYDSKKIRGEVWKAMSMMIAQLKRHHVRLVFVVPFRGGQHKDITQDLISKQMRRTTAQLKDISAAIEVLELNGVKIVCTDITTGKQTQHSPADFDTNAPTSYPNPPSAPAPVTLKTSVTTSQTSSRSGLSRQASPSNTFHRSPNHSCTLPSFPAWPSAPSDAPPRDPIDPVPQVQRRICPERSHSKQNSEDFDIMSAFGQLCVDRGCTPMMRDALQRYVGMIFPSHPGSSLTQEKRLATQWMAYYVLAHESNRNATQEELDNDRAVAMTLFRQLLTDHSRFIFPFCNSVIMILGCEGPNQRLQDFLGDCCEVIDKHMAGQELNYGSPFHLTRALWLENQEDITHLQKTFEMSTTAIGAIWGTDSPNYIVNRHYYAWLQLYNKNHTVAIDLLDKLIPEAKKILGDTHPVTANCYATLSRAYEESNDLSKAHQYLQKALETLDHSSRLLQKYTDRLQRRQALLYLEMGAHAEAEEKMTGVLNFRVEHFGIQDQVTWNAISDLVRILNLRGREAEAQRLEKDMNDRFLVWAYHSEMARNGGKVPEWVCRQCQNPTCGRNCIDANPSSSSKIMNG